MTPPTRNPWPTAASDKERLFTLDRATLDEIEMQLAVAIRKGQARRDWRHQARAAVRAGLARGVITPANDNAACFFHGGPLTKKIPSPSPAPCKSLMRSNPPPSWNPCKDLSRKNKKRGNPHNQQIHHVKA